jgi:FkbM family methyltransferase
MTNMIGKLLTTLRWAANHPVGRGEKGKAMLSFVRAQLGARVAPGDVCVAFPNESMLLVPPWMKGAAHFLWPGLVEFQEMAFVSHFLRAEDVFLDVGANIGAFTVLASAVAGARTISFEPGPFAFGFLVKNIRLNNLYAKVTARNMALGSKEGKTRFTSGLGTENHVVEGESGIDQVEVQISTLDVQTAGVEPIAIKIDVEGFEKEVLAGAKGLLKKQSLEALLVERVGNAPDEASLHEYIRSLGFVPCSYDADARKLARIPDSSEGTIIYVRNMEKAGARLREAPAVQFAGMKF